MFSMLARVAREGWARPVSALLSYCSDRGCKGEDHLKNLHCAIRVVKTEEILDILWSDARGATRAAVMRRAAAMGWLTVLEKTLLNWKKYPSLGYYKQCAYNVSVLKPSKRSNLEVIDALRVCTQDLVAVKLLKASPKIARSYVGEEIMWRAAENGWYRVLRKLIKNGVAVDSIGREGSTSLHMAIARGHEGCVHTLATNGASLELKDEDGWTPLHCAADRGNKRMVEILLEAGADPTIKDPFGLTPWDVATSGSIMALLPRLK
ncbi:Uncharacterized protein GBIM_14928 [Gryllus bimaculatus]|nr:Uncharacterized protein GBIM_14928 [Gryllus bimaculatus]